MGMGREQVAPRVIADGVEAVGAADDTRERIIASAIAVLADVGHGQFSVQKVARHAGVYQGNVTYYWPRRRDLVLALAVRVADEHRRTFLARFDAVGAEAVPRSESIVRAMAEDAVAPERVRLLPELWSMANADPEIARAVVRCQDTMVDVALEHLGASGRSCVEDVRSVLLLVVAAISGLTAVVGQRGPDDPVRVSLVEAVVGLHAPRLAEALICCGH
jgi:AcrR family transcriptional regulator